MISGDSMTAKSTGIDSMGGRTIISQTDSSYLIIRQSGGIRFLATGGTAVKVRVSSGAGDSVAYTYAAKDTLVWWIKNLGSGSYVAHVKKGAAGGDSTMTMTYSGSAGYPRVKLMSNDRLLDWNSIYNPNVFSISAGAFIVYIKPDSIKAN
jgi:hypothetical protein